MYLLLLHTIGLNIAVARERETSLIQIEGDTHSSCVSINECCGVFKNDF